MKYISKDARYLLLTIIFIVVLHACHKTAITLPASKHAIMAGL